MTNATANFKSSIFKDGAPITFTDAPVRANPSNSQQFQVSAPTRQIFDWDQTVTIKESTTTVFEQTAGIKSSANTVDYDVDFLFGIITRNDPTPPSAGDVTVSGNYIPVQEIGGANTFSWEWTDELADTTSYTNDGNMSRTVILSDLSISLERFSLQPSVGVTAEQFLSYIDDRDPILIECRMVDTGNVNKYQIFGANPPEVAILRAWCLVESVGYTGDVGSPVVESVELQSFGARPGASYSIKVS